MRTNRWRRLMTGTWLLAARWPTWTTRAPWTSWSHRTPGATRRRAMTWRTAIQKWRCRSGVSTSAMVDGLSGTTSCPTEFKIYRWIASGCGGSARNGIEWSTTAASFSSWRGRGGRRFTDGFRCRERRVEWRRTQRQLQFTAAETGVGSCFTSYPTTHPQFGDPLNLLMGIHFPTAALALLFYSCNCIKVTCKQCPSLLSIWFGGWGKREPSTTI